MAQSTVTYDGDAGSPAIARPARSEADAFEALDWGLLAGTALIWGSSFVLIALALEAFAPTAVSFLRLVFGVATLAAFPAARRYVPAREWPALAALGLLWMAIPFLLFPLAQQRIDSSLAGMLNGAVPLATAAVAGLVARRLPGRRQLVGLGLGFLGVVAIGWPAIQGATGTALGAGMVVLAVLCYGIAINVAAPLQRRYGALPVLLRAELTALVAVTPLGLWGLGDSSFALASLGAVVLLGSFSTALAYVGLGTLVGRVGPTRGSVTVYFTPVVAIVLGVLFLREAVAAVSLAGTALVIAGAWLASRKEVH
jgi:drug/metabolite transporter (DMT)-like permease